uniref:Uncharacterized protein n=1 Tax=Ditylenchus dipsaci TaxID=166011 RepID=A0A915D7Q2_9BILA
MQSRKLAASRRSKSAEPSSERKPRTMQMGSNDIRRGVHGIHVKISKRLRSSSHVVSSVVKSGGFCSISSKVQPYLQSPARKLTLALMTSTKYVMRPLKIRLQRQQIKTAMCHRKTANFEMFANNVSC